jgi:hypothetical protein
MVGGWGWERGMAAERSVQGVVPAICRGRAIATLILDVIICLNNAAAYKTE